MGNHTSTRARARSGETGRAAVSRVMQERFEYGGAVMTRADIMRDLHERIGTDARSQVAISNAMAEMERQQGEHGINAPLTPGGVRGMQAQFEAQRAQRLGGARGAARYERQAIDLRAQATTQEGAARRVLEDQAARSRIIAAQARNEPYEQAALRWAGEEAARQARLGNPAYTGDRARIAAARSESARYHKGDLSAPTPRTPSAKEWPTARENRLRADAYRHDFYINHGPGAYALPSERRAAQDTRDHLYNELLTTMNARAARQPQTRRRR